jgi:hypothetical protein
MAGRRLHEVLFKDRDPGDSAVYDVDKGWAAVFSAEGRVTELIGHERVRVPMVIPSDPETIDNVVALLLNAACRDHDVSYSTVSESLVALKVRLEGIVANTGLGALVVHDEELAAEVRRFSGQLPVHIHAAMPPRTVTAVGEAEYVGRVIFPYNGGKGPVGAVLLHRRGVLRGTLPAKPPSK